MAFKKGQSGNPKGRPKGSANKRDELWQAINKIQKGKSRTLIEHAITKAYEDNTILVAILRKLIPDLKAVEITGADGQDILKGITVKFIRPEEPEEDKE